MEHHLTRQICSRSASCGLGELPFITILSGLSYPFRILRVPFAAHVQMRPVTAQTQVPVPTGAIPTSAIATDVTLCPQLQV